MKPFCMLGCLRIWFTVEKLVGTPDSYVPWGNRQVSPACRIQAFGCLASLCATGFDEFIGYAKVPKEGWRYVALARRHYSLLEFGTFGKRDNIQSAVM